MKNFELLFEIIPNYPELNISIISDNYPSCVHKLVEFCNSVDANLYVKTTNEVDTDINENIHVELFAFNQPKYNKKSLQYDFLFLCSDVKSINELGEVFKKCYRVIKNAGNFFILSKKDESEHLIEILEDTNYVAISTIKLNEQYEIVSAKKMHGWRKV